MKKITAIMLGLTFVLGASAFAQTTKPATEKPAKTEKKKKMKKGSATTPTDSTTTKK